MDNLVFRTESAYSYPLLIKNLLYSPAAYDPAQIITYKGEKRFTYAQFRERVGRLAQALLDLGAGHGKTVAVLDYDSHRYLECFYAVPMIGAVLHTVNVRLSPEQLIYTIDHAEDDILLVHSDFLPILEQIKGRIDCVKKFVLITDGPVPPAGGVSFAGEYEDLLAAARPMTEFPDFDENTRATTFYTTGTTGMPKGVYFSHRQLVLHTLATLGSLGTAAHGTFHRSDVYMPITPMFHVHAWGVPYVATMLGVKQVYPGRYIPDVLLKLIAEEGVTFSHCVPTILHMLLKSPLCEKTDLSRWKVIIGGAALSRALCEAALNKGIDVFAGYGMSETCPILTLAHLTPEELKLPMTEQSALRCRTGVPMAMVNLKVTDDNGNGVPTDDKSAGEVQVRTPWLTQGYLKDHNNSEKLWQGGWLHTSDVAVMNSRRSIRITDRRKDIIKVGGEWVSSLELEDILLSHSAVAEAALIGAPDPQWGEVPLALVVLKAGQECTEKKISAFIKDYVDKGLAPREAILLKVRFIETIDKTSVGKINKIALREKYITA